MFFGRKEHLDRFLSLWRKKVPSLAEPRARDVLGTNCQFLAVRANNALAFADGVLL